VRLLEQALGVQEILDPGDKARRCDLLLELGGARIYNHEHRRILDDDAPVAMALAEEIGDNQRASQVCLLAVTAISVSGMGPGFGTAEAARWVDAFDRYAPPDTIERVRADHAMAGPKVAAGDVSGAWQVYRQCTLLARKLADASAFVNCGGDYLWFLPHTAEHIEEAREIAAEMRQVWDRADPSYMAYGMETEVSFFLCLGERRESEAIHRERMDSARLATMPSRQYVLPSLRGCYLVMDGQLEEAVRCYEDVLRLGAGMGAPLRAAVQASFFGPRLSRYLGLGQEQLRRFDEWVQSAGIPVLLARPRNYYVICGGEKEEVAVVLDEAADHYAAHPERTRHTFGGLVLLLEAAVLAEHRRAAQVLLKLLVGGVYKTTGLQNPTCVARHLGGAAALLGRHEEARNHYIEAIKVCTEMRFRPELALTRLQLAELILDHYPDEKKEAVEHLAFCIPEFRDMKMKPWLEGALKHKQILKA
jgi:tetratricopeptide (TPR) repeat protein